MKKVVIAIVLALLVVSVIWFTGRKDPVQVSLIKAELGEVKATVANTRAGTIQACRRSKLSMPMGGRVAKLFVDEGDKVTAGQVLLELWNKDQRARLNQAEANINAIEISSRQACVISNSDRRDANRLSNLVQRNLASEEAADTAGSRAEASELACQRAKADLNVAQAALELQQATFELTVLKAPFDGVVAEINGEIGEYVTPSPPGVATPPAVDLIDTGCLYVTAPIDEVDASAISAGLPAEITLDAFGDRVFPGLVTRIAPYVVDLEKQARTVAVDVRFDPTPDDIQLLVGYSADVTIVLQARNEVVRIPTETILEGNKVLYYDPATQILEQRTVTTGLSNWSYTEITAGLKAGDQIVSSLDAPGVEAGASVVTAAGSSQ